jgi:hypothetical protein
LNQNNILPLKDELSKHDIPQNIDLNYIRVKADLAKEIYFKITIGEAFIFRPGYF